MNALNQTLICNPEIEWSELLSVSFRPSACLHTFLICVSVCVWWWKNAKAVGWGKKKKTHTQLSGFGLTLLRQLLASRAANLTKQLKKQNTCARSVWSLNIMSRSRNLTIWKRNTSHAVANTNIGKKKL